MANTIKIRRSATEGATPTTEQLALGELAINTFDGKLFLKKDNGTASIVEVGAGGGGGGGSTNLSYDAPTRVLSSSTGTDATLPEVVAAGNSGLMTGADKTKLNGIEAGAQVNVATNLDYNAITRTLESSTGTDATIPEVTANGASGLMTGADKTKLDGIATSADVTPAYATQAEAQAGTNNTSLMTPLRTAQAISALGGGGGGGGGGVSDSTAIAYAIALS